MLRGIDALNIRSFSGDIAYFSSTNDKFSCFKYLSASCKAGVMISTGSEEDMMIGCMMVGKEKKVIAMMINDDTFVYANFNFVHV